jgi:hypothetical protein
MGKAIIFVTHHVKHKNVNLYIWMYNILTYLKAVNRYVWIKNSKLSLFPCTNFTFTRIHFFVIIFRWIFKDHTIILAIFILRSCLTFAIVQRPLSICYLFTFYRLWNKEVNIEKRDRNEKKLYLIGLNSIQYGRHFTNRKL